MNFGGYNGTVKGRPLLSADQSMEDEPFFYRRGVNATGMNVELMGYYLLLHSDTKSEATGELGI